MNPRELGVPFQPLASLAAKDPKASLAHIRAVYDNQPGPARDIVALNAGAAIYLAGLARPVRRRPRPRARSAGQRRGT